VIGWHRKGFDLFWSCRIRHGKRGRPAVPKEVRQLIRMLSRENPLCRVRKSLEEEELMTS
jgi:hypothetical protein